MFNIIKSLNYSTRRDTVVWITILTLLALPLIVLYLSGLLGDVSINKMTPSVYFASQKMGTVFILMAFGIMIFACKLVAGDAGDKTINYEFMAGHSRTKIFFGRMIAGFLWSAGLIFIFTILPLGYLGLVFGWGPETNKYEVIIRSLLLIFPLLRSSAMYMMIASVARSAGKGIALSYAVYMVISIVVSVLQDVFGIEVTYPTAMTNAALLLVSQNSRQFVINGSTVTVYDTSVTGEMVWKTIAVSLVFTAVYLLIAYINFKKTDRD